jgi:hypothetical protein
MTRPQSFSKFPQVKGRYYTAQILDEWAEVIVNINGRTSRRNRSASSRW